MPKEPPGADVSKEMIEDSDRYRKLTAQLLQHLVVVGHVASVATMLTPTETLCLLHNLCPSSSRDKMLRKVEVRLNS